jgi:hypothetical protein
MRARRLLGLHDPAENELDVSQFTSANPDGQTGLPTIEERIIPCATRDDAEREAARQQQLEVEAADWIYLQPHGQWIAKRVPRDVPPEPAAHATAQSLASDLAAEVLNPLNWLNPLP